MGSTNAPFGMKPAFHGGGGQIRLASGTIASGYGTAMYTGSPVTVGTNGTIEAVAAGVDNHIIGVFMGCQYVDAAGKMQVSKYWPASQVATEIVCWYTDDPEIIYEIQADATLALTDVGGQAPLSNVGGNATTGNATCTFAAGSISASTEGQLAVVGFARYPDNAPGDTYPVLLVKIAQHRRRARFDAF